MAVPKSGRAVFAKWKTPEGEIADFQIRRPMPGTRIAPKHRTIPIGDRPGGIVNLRRVVSSCRRWRVGSVQRSPGHAYRGCSLSGCCVAGCQLGGEGARLMRRLLVGGGHAGSLLYRDPEPPESRRAWQAAEGCMR
jgi:hypothetical protein